MSDGPRVYRPWNCYPNYLTCNPDGDEHLLRYAKHVADVSRLSGHAFFRCNQCQPASYFFAVFSPLPDPHAVCYAISEASFREWDGSSEQRSTNEMLYLLRDPAGNRLNPHYRPMK